MKWIKNFAAHIRARRDLRIYASYTNWPAGATALTWGERTAARELANRSCHSMYRCLVRGKRPQDRFGMRFVLLHLLNERSRRLEFHLGSDPIDELNLDLMAVKIAGEIEEKGLKKRLAIVESRSAAIACYAAINFWPCDDADGVNAVAQAAAWVRQKIDSWKTERAAEFLALDYLAYNGIGAAQQARRKSGIAGLESRSDCA